VTEPATTQTQLTPRAKISRLIELALLYVGLPAVAAALVDPDQRFAPVLSRLRIDTVVDLPMPISGLVFPSLFALSLPLLFALLGDPAFKARQLWNFRPFLRDAPRMLGLFAIGAVIMVGFAFLLDRLGILPDGGVFRLPREAPIVAVIIFVFYPWFSCYPQEISHRAFFFHRYEPVLGSGPTIVVVNAAVFAWFHAAFWNPWALGMTFAGGLLFAWTYLRTRSTLAVTIEHALYGWWAFMTGAGWFVYAGSVGSS
jgi:membrane protease YdiL (CAAX protease family)